MADADHTPTDLEAVPEPVAPEAGPLPRGKGARATFANGTAPAAMVTDGDGAVVDLVRIGAEAQEARFGAARALLDAGDLQGAREAFRALAIAVPRDKRYRLYMHYAWGCEHQAAGRPGEARSELERALRLDPNFAPAKQALAGLEVRKGWLRRLFGMK